jgi:hypothetical protein
MPASRMSPDSRQRVARCALRIGFQCSELLRAQSSGLPIRRGLFPSAKHLMPCMPFRYQQSGSDLWYAPASASAMAMRTAEMGISDAPLSGLMSQEGCAPYFKTRRCAEACFVLYGTKTCTFGVDARRCVNIKTAEYPQKKLRVVRSRPVESAQLNGKVCLVYL